MGSSTPQLLYSTSSRSLMGSSGIIPRKPKRLEIARAKVGRSVKRRRTSTATFQKKLVVFKCMGKMAPKSFTRADKHICMRGLLQPINLDASEEEVCKEICEVICSNPELADCNPSDFEFIDVWETSIYTKLYINLCV